MSWPLLALPAKCGVCGVFHMHEGQLLFSLLQAASIS